MTVRVILIAAAAAAACWVAAALGGLDAARWCAAACVAIATLALRHGRQATPRTPRYGRGRAVVRHAYPRYHQLTTTIVTAMHDRRYYYRVLTPLLDRVAAEVDDDAPVEAVRAEVTDTLDRFERRHRSWT